MDQKLANRRATITVLAAFAAALFAGAVFAEDVAQVTVIASRPMKQVVGRSNIGADIELISMTSRVNYSDLDIATHSGAKVLETRVNEAARIACKELDQKYPLATPDADRCTKAAVDSAMVAVRAAVSAAERKTHGQ